MNFKLRIQLIQNKLTGCFHLHSLDRCLHLRSGQSKVMEKELNRFVPAVIETMHSELFRIELLIQNKYHVFLPDDIYSV